MARLLPFAAIHYRERDVSELIAPPYDVLSAADATAMINQNPHNIAAIDTNAGGSYGHRAAVFEAWIANRVLINDPEPSFTVIAHEFLDYNGRQLRRVGLIGRIRVDDEIKVHEATHSAPKADRLELLRATKFHLSPIFLLSKGTSVQLDPLIAREPDQVASLDDQRIEVWRLSEPEQVSYVMDSFADSDLYVADGHHRLATSKLWAQECFEKSGDLKADSWFVPAYVCDAQDSALELLPTHRLVKRGDGLVNRASDVVNRLSDFATAKMCTRDEALLALKDVDGSSCGFAICGQDGAIFAVIPRPHGASASLDVAVLDEKILPLLGVAQDARERLLTYTRNIDEVVAGEEIGLAIACNPCSVNDVLEVADAKEVMPQKSTYFYPKVPTGLVLARA